MDVAGQWQREWVGAAEYGKVTEGGVTRRVTRAVEVMQASAPGTRMRVMRAAYHSTAGLGVPASTFMVHSSRRVFSSGSHFLESPGTQTRPLEISSTPLNSSPDSLEIEENYKVTEPDDLEISEPSKWKSSTDKSSIRMPSEESSSVDNASIVDLDTKTHHIGLTKKDSYDSIHSEIYQSNKGNNCVRVSPLLDAPVTLSTLKYKSLLNGTNDWNNRRKSYSFEDTSPLHETMLQTNDTIAMESSTDSGICKSTELVNEYSDDIKTKFPKYYETITYKDDAETDCFRGGTHIYVRKSPVEKNITLQSSGKVSITLPVTVEKDDEYKKNYTNDERVRRIKKVGFSKTELHFAAESGTVNIIATDEKPPPSYDFRKRRSAFVPINNKFEKPITLFGEKIAFSENITNVNNSSNDNSEISEFDENTAATRGILKNKIPKPKPYLLGENMAFGSSNYNGNGHDSTVSMAVSLINKQLQSERRYNIETTSSLPDESTLSVSNFHPRTNDKSPFRYDSLKYENNKRDIQETVNLQSPKNADTESLSSFEKKLNVVLQPSNGKTKTRQLRECDLTYFGVPNNKKDKSHNWDKSPKLNNATESTFRSVKLIQQVSNSIGSETECDDVPEYENIYIKPSYAPIPAPRSRTKYDSINNDTKDTFIIKPILEPDLEEKVKCESRRPRIRKHDSSNSSRSISEPPKFIDNNSIENRERQSQHRVNNSSRPKITDKIKRKTEDSNSNLNKSNNIQVTTSTYETTKTDVSDGKNTSKLRKKIYLEESSKLRKSNEHMDKSRSPSTVSNNGSLKSKSLNQNNKKQQKLSSHLYENKSKMSNERPSPDKLNTISSKTHCDIGTKTKEHHSKSLHRDSYRNETRSTKEKENRSPYRHKENFVNNSEKSGAKEDNKIDSRKKSGVKHNEISKNNLNCKRTDLPMQVKEKNNKDGNNLRTGSQNSHRSKYVINYDDKNGTVSSVRKIRPRTVSPKRKKTSEDKLNEESKYYNVKHETSSKPVRNAVPTSRKASNNLSYEDKKWKNKVRVRSCHLL